MIKYNFQLYLLLWQTELNFFQKYCLTLRDETEWVELVDEGVNALVGVNKSKILSGFDRFFQKSFHHTGALYGDGKSAAVIVRQLLDS